MNDAPPRTWTLTARWLFPVSAPPLPGGTITIRGRHIVAVEPAGSRTADLDLGNVAVLPGLVNAHTHLDLSGLRGRCPPGGEFTDWLRTVICHRRGMSPAQTAADIRSGLAESLAYGTTLLGDISALGLSRDALAAAPLRSIVFYELLGLPRERGRQAWEAAQAWLSSWPAGADDLCRPGLSPHAPYSVGRSLLRAVAEEARQALLPVTIHLAESLPELELLREHRGPFVPFLTDLGVWQADELVGSIAEIMQTLSDLPCVCLVHGNYLDERRGLSPPTCTAGINPAARHTVVYCPRTHAAFGHAPHPFRELLARGVRVALGTDSLASNPDLDVLAEARFLHARYPNVPGHVLLHLATLAGAEALGRQDEAGSLTAGKSADLVVVPLAAEEPADPHELVLDSSRPVAAVLFRGEWVRAPAPPGP